MMLMMLKAQKNLIIYNEKIILKFINIYQIFIFIALLTFNFSLANEDNLTSTSQLSAD